MSHPENTLKEIIDRQNKKIEGLENLIYKAEEYYEMAWQEWENGNWTAEEKKQFVSLLMKTLDQASHMDFRDKI